MDNALGTSLKRRKSSDMSIEGRTGVWASTIGAIVPGKEGTETSEGGVGKNEGMGKPPIGVKV